MKTFTHPPAVLRAALLAGLLFGGTAAQARITAEQVWQDYLAYMESFGYEVEAQLRREGGALLVSDLVATFELPEQAGTVALRIDGLRLTDLDDGRVDISLPETFPFVVSVDPADDQAVKVTIQMELDDFSLTASGDPGDVTYTYAAQAVGATLGEIRTGGVIVAPDVLAVAMTVADLGGVSRVRQGDPTEISQTATIGHLGYSFSFDDPDSDDAGSIEGGLDGLAFDGGMVLPRTDGPVAPEEMFAAGMAGEGSVSLDGGALRADVAKNGKRSVADLELGSGRFDMSVGADRLAYSDELRALRVHLESPDLPVPVDLSVGAVGGQISVPLSAGPEIQPTQFGFGLEDLSLSDGLWVMFDPGGQLPREPITIAARISAGVKLLVDLFDPARLSALEARGAPPGSVEWVRLDELKISLAGARISGSGEVKLDNTDTVSYGGLPKPVGSVELQARGLNGLLDRLIAMGAIGQDEAMGMRMMLSMFSSPAGDDALTSRIEFNDMGQILANGQRLK